MPSLKAVGNLARGERKKNSIQDAKKIDVKRLTAIMLRNIVNFSQKSEGWWSLACYLLYAEV